MTALPERPASMVSVRHVSWRYKDVEALDDISLDVPKGSLFGFVGSDGAGKSTLLRLIATLMKPRQGKIVVDGRNVATEARSIKNILGYMPQRFGLYADLTVAENFNFFLDVFGVATASRKAIQEKYLGFSNLLPFVNRPAGQLSGGMKQKLGLACVLAHEPRVLILDEPTNGVDPVSRREFWDILLGMKKEGMTLLVSTAYLDEARLCDQIALMHRSVLLDVASPDVLSAGFKTLEEAVIARIVDVDQEIEHDAFLF